MAQRVGTVGGHVAPGFEPVREAFARHIAAGMLGGACTIYHRGECVVDLHGGWKNEARTRPWDNQTITLVFSVSKGLSGAACALAASRGYFDYDQPIGEVWPEFACHGKEALSVGQVLSEQAGVAALDSKLSCETMADHALMAQAVAEQKPNWTPGDYSGNHPYSLGWLACELIHRGDRQGRHLDRFLAEEIARPLDADVWFGLPHDFDTDRIARIKGFGLPDMVLHRKNMSWALIAGMFAPWTLTFRALNNPLFLQGPAALDTPEFWHIEQGAAGGMASAKGLAKVYNAFATGGAGLGISPAVMDALAGGIAPPRKGLQDQVLHCPVRYSHGFEKPFDGWEFARNRAAFGTFAVGGSLAFAHPEDQVAYAWVTNEMGTYKWDDPREKDCRDAFYQCLEETGA